MPSEHRADTDHPSAGRIVAVLGAMSPASAASSGVMDGSGLADSPLELRVMGALAFAFGSNGTAGSAADASARGRTEPSGAMSVESDIVVSASGAPAPGGADASAVA